MKKGFTSILSVALLFVCMFGCATPTRSWTSVNREVLWTAMMTEAETPDYKANDPRKRWIVIDNKVDNNAHIGRIEVHRTLARSLLLPRQKEQHDRRVWFFDIRLLPLDPMNPDESKVTFEVTNSHFVRAQSLDEADRYFKLVDELLK